MTADKDPKSLLNDKSLSQIWWSLNVTSRAGIKNSRIAVSVITLTATATFYYVATVDALVLPEQIRFIALHGLRLVTGVLSFLLAGFVFLLSSSNADLLYTMFQNHHKQSGLDYLRYNTFSLLALFSEFVFGALAFTVVVVLGQPHGLVSSILANLPDHIHQLANRAAFFFFGMLLFLFVLRLKSFITNVYHFSMTALALRFIEIQRIETEKAEQLDREQSGSTTVEESN